ncbi:MAG TPA: tetratricopeptide repeat protein [Opitutaceae bacterium]|nr:tetratricopeptide repeat protein [Opitutaceae bacterium]
MLLRPFVASLSALALTVPSLVAQTATATPAPAAAQTPATPAKLSGPELAYWKQLQTDVAEMRSANLTARIRTAPYEATPQDLSAIASRLEKFLDRRDKDPVADLGPELKEYRERLVKLVELALAPVTASAKFKSTMVTNGEERMFTLMKILKQVGEVNDFKPKLALLHDALNLRSVAAGGQVRFFFQTIGIGDEPVAAGSLGSFDERDAQFLKDSAAIGQVFADLARGNFVENRKKHGLTDGLMEPLIQTIEKFRTQFADSPTDQLQEGLKTAKGVQEAPGEFNLKRHVLILELMRRVDDAAYAVAMQEFQGAFLRWLGKIDDIAPLGLCRDVATAQDGSWFAHSPSEKTIVIREAASGKIRATLETDSPVRSLAAAPANELMFFTGSGLYFADATSDHPVPALRSALKSVFIEPRAASSRTPSRYVFALGIKPGVQRDDVQQTFSVQKAASRVTSVASSDDGLMVAYGYAGDNVTGSGEPQSGYSVLQFTGKDDEFGKQGASTASHQIRAPLVGAVLSLSMSGDGKAVASATYGIFGGSVAYDENPTGEVKRNTLALDSEAYHWVHLLGGKPVRVVAGTRSGNVRVWDATSRELLSAFTVPVGGGGAAYGMLGEEVISVSLGQTGVHRWKLDGSLVASYEGETARPDAAALAARLAAEREYTPARETLLAALNAEGDDARLKLIETLRGPLAKQVDGLGMRTMVDNWFAGIRISQIRALGKEKRALEAFELGYKEISTGVVRPYLVYITLFYANRISGKDATPELKKRRLDLGERAIALYPTEVSVHREYREARVDHLQEQGKIKEAMKEVDELDIIDPNDAPHGDRRWGILMYAYDFANKAGRDREAMQALMDAQPYASDNKDSLMLALNIFSIAYKLKDWQLSVNAANMALNVDPNQKNDASFMAAARYAYQMANPQKK